MGLHTVQELMEMWDVTPQDLRAYADRLMDCLSVGCRHQDTFSWSQNFSLDFFGDLDMRMQSSLV